MSKRYIEIVDVDENGNRKVISSEEQKEFSPKKAVSDFAEKHPKVVKAAKVTGVVILAGGAALLGASAAKAKNGSSPRDLLSADDQKLLENPESDTGTIPVEDANEVSNEEC